MKNIFLILIIALTFTACDDITNIGTNLGTNPGTNPGTDSGTDPGTNPGTDPNHTHRWGAWMATELAGTEERVCGSNATHIEARLTGTGRFNFQAISGVAAYSVSKGTSNIGTVRIPSYYRPSEENEWQPVTAINYSAFENCTSLIGIYIPEGITSIGGNAFSGCIGLASVTIPAGITNIGGNAFSSCIGLASVTIPAGVTSIGSSAFSGCTSLASITIPDSVMSIGQQAFSNTAWFNNHPDGLVYAGKVLYTYKGTMPADTVINNIRADTVAIVESTFYYCTSLASITIPASVTSIGQYAFSNCTSLVSITIPNSVTSIGGSAFYNCTSLTSITVDANNPNYASQDGILYNKAKTTFIYIPQALSGNITIPASVTSIGSMAFSGCTGLTNITIPASVTEIGGSAFYNCTSLATVTFAEGFSMSIGNWFSGLSSLTTVNIPASVTSIGSSAFSNCTSPTNITIPEGVTSIGGNAFYRCTDLASITIPASVTEIGGSAFYNCTSLASIMVNINNPNYASQGGILYNKAKTTLIQVPGGISGTVTISASVTSIGDGAFSGCTSLASITIPASVTSIGRWAFSDWTSSQRIYVKGYASEAAADSAWGSFWRAGCNTTIVYQGGQ